MTAVSQSGFRSLDLLFVTSYSDIINCLQNCDIITWMDCNAMQCIGKLLPRSNAADDVYQ